MSHVRVINAALEDDADTGDVVIRGVIDPTTLKFIHIGWYQREQGFSHAHTDSIIASYFSTGRIPDITLGMRGQRVKSSTGKDAAYILLDKVYCIDGGQRLYAAAMALKERKDLKLSLGAKVYLNTTEETETEMFGRLGTTQVRIAPSVLMRNRKKQSAAALILVSLNDDPQFALKHRIAWDQVKTSHELMSGYALARVAGALHSHKGGAMRSSKVYELLSGLDVLLGEIGPDTFRTNMVRLFDAIDKCWTIRHLTGTRDEQRPHLKAEFLHTVCSLFSKYPEFWDGAARNEFYFGDKHVKRLRGFKLADYLTAARHVPKDVLFEVLRKRLNLNPVFEDNEINKEAAE
jgi:hypothetical protein